MQTLTEAQEEMENLNGLHLLKKIMQLKTSELSALMSLL